MSIPDHQPTAMDLLSTMWRFPEFLEHEGPLNESLVLEYFSHSPFYDRQSSNQVLKMQTMHTGEPLMQPVEEELKRFTGTEFVVAYAIPPSLFVIHKRHRISPDETFPQAAYYVLHNNVYQAPDLYSVVTSRVLTALSSLLITMDLMKPIQPPFHPRATVGQAIMSVAPPQVSQQPAPAENGVASSSRPTRTTTSNVPPSGNQAVLLSALRTTSASLASLRAKSSTNPQQQPVVPSTTDGFKSQTLSMNFPTSLSSQTSTPLAISGPLSVKTPKTPLGTSPNTPAGGVLPPPPLHYRKSSGSVPLAAAGSSAGAKQSRVSGSVNGSKRKRTDAMGSTPGAGGDNADGVVVID